MTHPNATAHHPPADAIVDDRRLRPAVLIGAAIVLGAGVAAWYFTREHEQPLAPEVLQSVRDANARAEQSPPAPAQPEQPAFTRSARPAAPGNQ